MSSLRSDYPEVLFACVPEPYMHLPGITAADRDVLRALIYLIEVDGNDHPTRKEISRRAGVSIGKVSIALGRWRRHEVIRFELDSEHKSGRRFRLCWRRMGSRPGRNPSTHSSPSAHPEIRGRAPAMKGARSSDEGGARAGSRPSFIEKREKEDVPSPYPLPQPEPAAPVIAEPDGTGRISPPGEAENPGPTPDQLATWERDQNQPGHVGRMARLMLAGWRQDQEARDRPPAPPSPPPPSRPVALPTSMMTPTRPIVEGRCPPGRLRPDESQCPQAEVLALARSLDSAPDRSAAAEAFGARLARRYREPDNPLTVKTFARAAERLPGDYLAGEIREVEASKLRWPNRVLARRLADALAERDQRASVVRKEPSPGEVFHDPPR